MFLLGCAAGEVSWAVQYASILPTTTGFTGTQTWAFFDDRWSPDDGEGGYVCSRAQTATGTVTTLADCADCRVAYAVAVEELGTDCEGDEADSEAYAGPDVYAIAGVPGDLEAQDPHPGDSFGWFVAWGDDELSALGWAYPEAVDHGEAAASGFAVDQVYTLWPAVAWSLP